MKTASTVPSETVQLSTNPFEIIAAKLSESLLAESARLNIRIHCTCRQMEKTIFENIAHVNKSEKRLSKALHLSTHLRKQLLKALHMSTNLRKRLLKTLHLSCFGPLGAPRATQCPRGASMGCSSPCWVHPGPAKGMLEPPLGAPERSKGLL